MRFFLLLALTLLSVICFAQSNFAKQVKAIIADSSNDFRSFQGSFKELQKVASKADSVYTSILTISDTRENDIVVTKEIALYRAVVIDSVTEKRGKKIVDEWVEKISPILGSSYKLDKTELASFRPTKYGWEFKKGNMSVSLDVYPESERSSKYWVSFGIAYFHLKSL